MANVLVTIAVQNQVGAVPLNGVTVRVYEDDGTTFVTEGVTGPPFAAGEVEFTLFGDTPAVDYIVRLALAGWRFPAGATLTISVTDPASPDNDFGPFDAAQGPSAPLVRLVVEDDQLVPAPINEVVIRIYSSPADAFLAEVETGEGAELDGEASLALAGSATPGTTYIVRLSKPGVRFDPNPTQTIAVQDPLPVGNTNTFDFVGLIPNLPISLDPDLCRITGILVDASLRPLIGRVVRFLPVVAYPYTPKFSAHFTGNPTLVRDLGVLAPVRVVTDSEGRVDVELPRNGVYNVHIHGFEHPMVIAELIRVPDADSAEFRNVVWPFVTQVLFDIDPINLVANGDSVEVELTVNASNGQQLVGYDALNTLLEFTSGDEAIATVTLLDDNKLLVQGLQAGSTTISVARREGTVAPRRPDVDALIFTPPTVVVT